MKEPKEMKILIIDDMPNMVRTIKNMLRHLGYRHTAEAGDGLAAWKILKNDTVDFVIADWNMPNMTGIDLLRKVRLDESLKDIPFLMVTAEVAEETIAEAAETEVDGYIIKPFVAKTLEEKIQKILERRNSPDEVDTCLKLGNVYANSGRLEDALKEYEKAIKVRPNNARLYCAMGNAYQRRGEIDEAEKAYRKAIGISPQYLKAHESLAWVYEKKGEKEKAIKSIKEAVKISPKNPDRLIKLGKALLNTGRREEAKEAFDQAVKIDPDSAAGRRIEIGEAFLDMGMAQEAEEVFQRVLGADPNNIEIYNRLGVALRKQGKYRVAIGEYKKALKVDPEDENVHYNLGRTYVQAGMVADAIKEFEESVRLYPDFEEAKIILQTLKEKEQLFKHETR